MAETALGVVVREAAVMAKVVTVAVEN